MSGSRNSLNTLKYSLYPEFSRHLRILDQLASHYIILPRFRSTLKVSGSFDPKAGPHWTKLRQKQRRIPRGNLLETSRYMWRKAGPLHLHLPHSSSCPPFLSTLEAAAAAATRGSLRIFPSIPLRLLRDGKRGSIVWMRRETETVEIENG